LLPQFCLYLSLKADDGSDLKFNTGAFFESDATAAASWFFDPDAAAWIEKGTDPKIDITGNGYYMMAHAVGQVRVTGTLHINGFYASHYPIRISYPGQQRHLYTTNTGSWSMLLPAGTSCVASVVLPCGDEQHVSFDVSDGPTSVLPISLQDPDVINAFIKGIVRGCGAEVIQDPLLIIRVSTAQYYFPSETGIALYYPACAGSSMDIQAINQNNLESGPFITWQIEDTVDLHSVFACDAAKNEYLYLNVAGDQKMYWDMSSAFTTQDRVLIETGENEPGVEFQIFISGDTVGEYEDTKLNILFEDMQLGSRGFSLNCPTATSGCGFTKFTITHFSEESGQWIRGHFRGKFWIKTFHPLTAGYRDVSGEFQVYREF
jgi:hypothetical protein